mmetsp:Transcript_56628/g.157764  ORF Transcript_56628/g.157764 Transcript_56628/m.157764 type:complete len:534 (+) Transcript_56628:80-1681(+)
MGSLVVGIAWLLVMFYIMLFCQHRICEAYFVPALNVLMDRMGNSQNPWLKRLGDPGVAGATFMALGANGPELFTNLFALFAHSDGGIGVVIGSEIFNLLVIIGASVIATKTLPLQLERVPFARDVTFYAFSIALLVWALGDEKIVMSEALIMLCAGLSYWATVYFTEDIANKLFGGKAVVAASSGGKQAKVHGVVVEVEEIYHSRMADGHGHNVEEMDMQPTENGILAETRESEVGNGRGSVGFAVAGDGGLLGGGGMMMYKDLKEVLVMGEGVIELKFQRSLFESVTLKVKTIGGGADRDMLLANLEKYSGCTYIHNYDPTVCSSIDHLKHHVKDGGCMGKIHAVLEFFVDALLSTTMFWCDVKDMKKEALWIPCFLCSMFWLAAFSYAMVYVMGQIAANISWLTPMLLGVTLGAIGTSLPNAMGSIIMSSQGKSAAAIGNAFGSNVQNVFLAMAGPWAIYLAATGDKSIPFPPPQKGQSITEGVAWMLGTLVMVVFFAILPQTCTLSKSMGWLFVITYAGYLIWTVIEFEG